MRRYTENMNGERYLGNSDKKEVHDLDNEQGNCQIDEIVEAGHDSPFNSITEARSAGFDNGHSCSGA